MQLSLLPGGDRLPPRSLSEDAVSDRADTGRGSLGEINKPEMDHANSFASRPLLRYGEWEKLFPPALRGRFL